MNAAEARRISEEQNIKLRREALEKSIKQISDDIKRAAYGGTDHVLSKIRVPLQLFSTDENISNFNDKIKTKVRQYDYTICCRSSEIEDNIVVLVYNISW